MFLFLTDYVHIIPDILGIIGVILVLVFYLLLQIGQCSPEGLLFSAGNFVGSVLLLFSLWYNWNLASVIIEVAWLFISLYGVINYFYKLKKRKT